MTEAFWRTNDFVFKINETILKYVFDAINKLVYERSLCHVMPRLLSDTKHL